MRDQSQPWRDRTAHEPPQDPWASAATTPLHPEHPQHGHTADQARAYAAPETSVDAPQASPYQRGVAHVKPSAPRTEPFTAAHEPTGTGWPGAGVPQERQPLGYHVRQLKKGGRYTFSAAMFAFVSWAIWALSEGGDLLSPVLVFVMIMLVAAGLFALARVLGRLVIERRLGRVRRSAVGAHLVTAIFLTGVGVTYLGQVAWIRDAWNWTVGLF
jgi:hypothetical protein